jgi:triphosphatase
MEFELHADSDAIAKLGAFKPLASVREGRPRSYPVKLIWHDSPDHALRGRGEVLVESRGSWRLERLLPGDETWLPAQPSPVLAEATSLDELTVTLPQPLAAVAAFEGRRTVSTHRFKQSLVTLSVERGILRSVTAEQPVVRLVLEGEDLAVRAAAHCIAAGFPARVPVTTFAARGMALATNTPPLPRHLGPPELTDGDIPVADALAHILGHLTDAILYYAPAATRFEPSGGDGPKRIEAVHQMRVAVRRALSALSIFRSTLPDATLEPVRTALKALAQALAHTRDWDVFVGETASMVAETLPDDQRLGRLVAAADRVRREHRVALAAYLSSPAFRLLGIDLAWFCAARCWQAQPTPPLSPQEVSQEDPAAATAAPAPLSVRHFAPHVVRHRWKKMLAAGKHVEDLDIPALHALRLRAKRARYAAEMFAGLDDSKGQQRTIRRIAALQQHLGMLNDGAVAADLMQELGGPAGRHGYAVGVVTGFIAARAGLIRPAVNEAFEKLRRRND